MTPEAHEETAELAWRVHPAAERPGLAVVVAGLILTLAVLAGVWMGSAYWGVFAGVVLFLSLEAFFLPASFELDAKGVRVRKPFSQVERGWETLRRVIFDPAGVTLSPFARRRWIEPYRALRLRYPTGRRTAAGEVPARLRAYLLARCDPSRVRMVGLPPGEADLWATRARAAQAAASGEESPQRRPVEEAQEQSAEGAQERSAGKG
ncbi:MAG: hypothetical protein GF330_12400 [Candidatus Eisenbacteria bacterium]|nr:hypothetical protein [Candidatus Eisenbacteria bacterium]